MTKDIIRIGLAFSAYVAVTKALKKYEDKKSFNDMTNKAAIEEAENAVTIAEYEARIADHLLELALRFGDTEAISTARQRMIAADDAHGEALEARKALRKAVSK